VASFGFEPGMLGDDYVHYWESIPLKLVVGRGFFSPGP